MWTEDRSPHPQRLGREVWPPDRVDLLFDFPWTRTLGALRRALHYLLYIARCPKLRSKFFPWGFDKDDPATRVGNLLLLRTLIVLKAIHIAGKDRSMPLTVGSHMARTPGDPCSFLR